MPHTVITGTPLRLPVNFQPTVYHNTDTAVFTIPVKRVKIIVIDVFL